MTLPGRERLNWNDDLEVLSPVPSLSIDSIDTERLCWCPEFWLFRGVGGGKLCEPINGEVNDEDIRCVEPFLGATGKERR